MIFIIAKGLLNLVALPIFLIISPYYHFRYWERNAIIREGGGYRGRQYTYKNKIKEVLFDEEFIL